MLTSVDGQIKLPIPKGDLGDKIMKLVGEGEPVSVKTAKWKNIENITEVY